MKTERRTETIGIVLMLICVACLCTGQFIWKGFDGVWSLVGGFAIYCVGALAMLVAYRFGRLSVLQPINSLSVVVSAVLGFWAFNEEISILKAFGIVFILAGVVLIAKGDDAK